MHYLRWQRLLLIVALVGIVGVLPASAGPLAVVANFTDPGVRVNGPPWPPGTVSFIDTDTDQQVGFLQVGSNPMAVGITPDGKTALVACSQDSEIDFIDLTANPPKITTKLKVGEGTGDTFYPGSISISADGNYAVVTSVPLDQGRATQIDKLLVIQIKDPNADPSQPALPPSVVQTMDLTAYETGFTAEAATFTPQGSVIITGPHASPPVIFAMGFGEGSLLVPDPDDDTTQMGAYANASGFSPAVAPDGSFAVIPMINTNGPGYFDSFALDSKGRITVSKELISSGGSGPQSAVISPDGKTLYVRNFNPPTANIAVFQVKPGPEITDTGARFICPGFPTIIAQLLNYGIPFTGSQMIAVTPDGKKLYATNAYDGSTALGYGNGNVRVYTTDNPAPLKTLAYPATFSGKNPLAIAIQPVVPKTTP
jgi:DNA-binding beta-propeller fold protein YncE